MSEQIPLEKDAERLTKIYRKIRSAKEQLTSEYKKKYEEYDTQLQQCAKLLLELIKENNTTGLKTAAGTVTRVVKNKYWNTDWPEFHKFVRDNNLLELLEHRLAQNNVAEYLEKNPGVAVPGLQMERRYDVVVRKPTESNSTE